MEHLHFNAAYVNKYLLFKYCLQKSRAAWGLSNIVNDILTAPRQYVSQTLSPEENRRVNKFTSLVKITELAAIGIQGDTILSKCHF